MNEGMRKNLDFKKTCLCQEVCVFVVFLVGVNLVRLCRRNQGENLHFRNFKFKLSLKAFPNGLEQEAGDSDTPTSRPSWRN